jgi:hypothetical protein
MRYPKKWKPDDLNHDGIDNPAESSEEYYGSKRAAAVILVKIYSEVFVKLSIFYLQTEIIHKEAIYFNNFLRPSFPILA